MLNIQKYVFLNFILINQYECKAVFFTVGKNIYFSKLYDNTNQTQSPLKPLKQSACAIKCKIAAIKFIQFLKLF